MILLIPVKIDLSGMPDWFVWLYVIVYAIGFAAVLASFGYLIWQLLT